MGIAIGLISGFVFAFLGPYIKMKRDRALISMLYLLSKSPWGTIGLVVVAGPIIEELVFRLGGFYLVGFFSPQMVWKIALTSIAFGLAHAQFPHNVLAGVIGVVLAVTFINYGLVQAIVAHGIHNAVVLAHFLISFRRLFQMPVQEALKQHPPSVVAQMYQDVFHENRT